MVPEYDLAAGMPDTAVSVSDFVDLLNETYEFAFPSIVVSGELANLRVSKNKWLYFDLKDDGASVKFFGTVYQLPGPLEDGMLLNVRGTPHMHEAYGFSVNVQTIQAAGEGSIRRAAELLQIKLEAEGLFAADRKRRLPYPPERIGLITSGQSAAYADFIKILAARWAGLNVAHIDVQVQGEIAPLQIVEAIETFNTMAEPPEVLVLIRGGGIPEDLAAFSTESVTRAVASSRVPTLVAIGHEIDVSLAELAADVRASTPSNAAELLVPDKATVLSDVAQTAERMYTVLVDRIEDERSDLNTVSQSLQQAVSRQFDHTRRHLEQYSELLMTLSPEAALRRGYSVLRTAKRKQITDEAGLPKVGDDIIIQHHLAELAATVTNVEQRRHP